MPRRAVRCVSKAPARMTIKDRWSTTAKTFLTRRFTNQAIAAAASRAHNTENHHEPYQYSPTWAVPLYFSTIVAAAITTMTVT